MLNYYWVASMGHFTTTRSRRNALLEHMFYHGHCGCSERSGICVLSQYERWQWRCHLLWFGGSLPSILIPLTSISLSLSLSQLPPQPPVNHSFRYAPLVTQDMLVHFNDRLHQAPHTRTYTVEPNYW